MAHALEGPISIVSRYISTSPRRPNKKILASGSPTKLSSTTSKVLAALENLDCSAPSDDTESEIEVIGPFVSKRVPERNRHVNRKYDISIKAKPNAIASSKPTLKPVRSFWGGPNGPSLSTSEDIHVDWQAEQMVQSIDNSRIPHRPENRKAPEKQDEGMGNTDVGSYSLKSSHPLDKEFPLYSYKDFTKPKPVLVYTKHEGEADDLVDGLKPGPVALDIEWRVFFTKKSASSTAATSDRRAAVVQLADTAGLILVIQVYNMARFPEKLQALIENPKIPKLGANILNDGAKLFRDYGILGRDLVELGALSLFVDPGGAQTKRKIISLAKLVELYCHKTLNKGNARTGNWEAELNATQLEYAGNDVHCTVMVYHQLVAIAKERGVKFNIFDPQFSSEVQIKHKPLESNPASKNDPQASSVATSISRTQSNMAQHLRPESVPTRISPQYLRAYRYWHDQGMGLDKMCLALSTKGRLAEGAMGEPLKNGTVISYVIGALQNDPRLPFDMIKLRNLVQSDTQSWVRHRDWILKVWIEKQNIGE